MKMRTVFAMFAMTGLLAPVALGEGDIDVLAMHLKQREARAKQLSGQLEVVDKRISGQIGESVKFINRSLPVLAALALATAISTSHSSAPARGAKARRTSAARTGIKRDIVNSVTADGEAQTPRPRFILSALGNR